MVEQLNPTVSPPEPDCSSIAQCSHLLTDFQARDHYGHTPLHKAVMANQESIVKYLVDYFPELIESRDNVSINSCSD